MDSSANQKAWYMFMYLQFNLVLTTCNLDTNGWSGGLKALRKRLALVGGLPQGASGAESLEV